MITSCLVYTIPEAEVRDFIVETQMTLFQFWYLKPSAAKYESTYKIQVKKAK